jgi:peptidoglycan/xylan/chitin deacetylase (PgdA/CDA1 family)
MVIAALLVLATAYLLQADDSLLPAQASVTPASVVEMPLLKAQAGAGGREYFVSRHEVVPVGAAVIDLPILMYHYIRTPPSPRDDWLGYKLSVSPDDFRAQMDWLYAHHYHPVNFDQVRAYFAGEQALPSRPIVLTFDDGYQDLYTAAFPILQAHAFTAVAYIVSGFVDRPGYVSRQQVVQMDRSGIEIASHTVDHASLDRVSYGQLNYQLVQSKHWLEALVRHPIVDFAYPSGKHSALAVSMVGSAGYDTAVITDGSSRHSRDNRYIWGRVRVGGGETLAEFAGNLGPAMPATTISSLDVEPS